MTTQDMDQARSLPIRRRSAQNLIRGDTASADVTPARTLAQDSFQEITNSRQAKAVAVKSGSTLMLGNENVNNRSGADHQQDMHPKRSPNMPSLTSGQEERTFTNSRYEQQPRRQPIRQLSTENLLGLTENDHEAHPYGRTVSQDVYKDYSNSLQPRLLMRPQSKIMDAIFDQKTSSLPNVQQAENQTAYSPIIFANGRVEF